ncbi:hypothetical protein C6H68_03020 [Photorhabdus luminescens]|nr:hypothetical protein C6H68_03020 [Photorhabdus luminescens]
MLIQLGKLLMSCVWGFLIFNLIHPFPKPLKYFMDIAMIFMVVMHAFQMLLLKASQPKDQKLSSLIQTKIFFFGVFELLSMQKKTTEREKSSPKIVGMGSAHKHPKNTYNYVRNDSFHSSYSKAVTFI